MQQKTLRMGHNCVVCAYFHHLKFLVMGEETEAVEGGRREEDFPV